MMEHETLNLPSPKDDLEEGELSDSDSDGYTPLARPDLAKSEFASVSVSLPRQMDIVSDEHDDDELQQDKSDTDGSSDESGGNIRLGSGSYSKRMLGQPSRAGHQRTLNAHPKSVVAGKPNPAHRAATTGRPNKYNIWTESLQEDTLMETMRGCDVTANGMRNRDVESYDYKLRSRLQSGNAFERLKRRQSNSDDSDGYAGGGKRMRTSHSSYPEPEPQERRGSVKDRIGKRNNSTDSNSDDCAQNAPRFDCRHIPDLNVEENCSNESFGIELAGKLCETHTDLMVRVVEALGKEIPTKLFKETQKIEADGGMLVMKGWRRRTPGGVFLFLLKHCEEVDQEIKKTIFQEDKKAKQKEWKLTKHLNRDKKVEELKKTLNRQAANDTELPSIPIMSHLKAETHSTLSNPPPSPVGEENFEGGSDYESRNIHVNVTTSPDKALLHTNDTDKDSDACPEDTCRLLPDGPTPMRSLASYQEDCLDITCDDMDLF
ncbi:phosphorylated adapter RNA export protein isoform X1 [Anopheles moucheti]|uniref:phosphorylated adapter RNA export protein isoform X1 n=1 Tax=Anopheles moucheti TaxID=186751 RepID=UPI0022F09A24|nr:phosphorylated adapter RNA export protein isoform X1 [Anopheles moucheti]